MGDVDRNGRKALHEWRAVRAWQLYKAGWKKADIARRLGVSQSNMNHLIGFGQGCDACQRGRDTITRDQWLRTLAEIDVDHHAATESRS
jgi:hypothetical protein